MSELQTSVTGLGRWIGGGLLVVCCWAGIGMGVGGDGPAARAQLPAPDLLPQPEPQPDEPPMIQSELLQQQRWQEMGYGISMQPPRGFTPRENDGSGAVVKFVRDDYTHVAMMIRQYPRPVELEEIRDEALRNMAFLYPDGVRLEDPQPFFRLTGRPATRVIFQLIEPEVGGLVVKQVIFKLDPSTDVLLQFRTPVPMYEEEDQAVFQAVLESLHVSGFDRLDARRNEMIEAGTQWRSRIDFKRLEQLINSDQWMRIRIGDRDVGYALYQFQEDLEGTQPGLRVNVRSRNILSDDRTIDSFGDYFEDSDALMEIWSLRIITERRSPEEILGQDAPRAGRVSRLSPEQAKQMIRQMPMRTAGMNFSETGVRRGELGTMIEVRQDPPMRQIGVPYMPQVEIHRPSPDEVHLRQPMRQPHVTDMRWQIPKEGYLSQVELRLLPWLLPMAEKEMAFYCFDSRSASLSLFTVRIVPADNGHWHGYLRPRPHSPEQVVVYDQNGRMLRWELGDGRVYKPTTTEELRRLWRIR